MNRRSLLFSSLTALAFPLEAFAQSPQTKSLAIVPRSGPLADTTVYTNSYAVLVGVSAYAHLGKNLSFAAKDATDLRDVLVASYGFLPENIAVLTDKQATKRGIEKALAQLANGGRVKETDRVLVFFSGHGQTVKLPTGGEMGFLIPHDAEVDLNKPEDNSGYLTDCIAMNRVWEFLEACPARHRLLIADACFGGLLIQPRSPGARPNLAAIKNLLARPALQAITAGGRSEEALEYPKLGHGALTFKLLEELKALAATPGELLLASELGTALKTSVANITDAKQTPQFGSHGTEGEFLFISVGKSAAPPVPKPPINGGKAVVDAENFRGGLLFSGAPVGAVIKVDGKVVSGGRFEADLVEEASKSVSVVITAPGFKAKGGRTTIKRGANLEFDARLEPEPMPEPVVLAGKVKGARKTRKGNAEMCFIPGNGTVSDFWMDAAPVTVAQWKAYCAAMGKSMPSAPSWGWIDDHPMVNVSWHDASGYATWAGGRLPTSAEFEYAARDGGRNIEYPWGDSWDGSKVWSSVKPDDVNRTAPVRRSDHVFVNSHGLSDMAGNVWQWCSDGPASSFTYLKGGSWNIYNAEIFRCANRNYNDPTNADLYWGFRLLHPGL